MGGREGTGGGVGHLSRPFDREILSGPVLTAARELLGAVLEVDGPRGTVAVALSEVEAYAGMVDPASHAYRGRTARNAVMFGPAGFAYVYFVFGMHWCLNIVCGATGEAAAVLVRAGAVIAGEDVARSRRGAFAGPSHELARGPGRLAVALAVDGRVNGSSMVDGSGPLTLVPRPPSGVVLAGPRTGVAGAADRPWRFWLAGEKSVSPYRRHVPRSRGNSPRS